MTHHALEANHESLVAIRRHLHQHPELSFEEYETSAYIKQRLDDLGVSWTSMATTGVVATIGFGKRCVALRADIDALPMTEETGLPYRSRREGVMHACGHDMHTSMLLEAAAILKRHESELGGTVKLLFQPGEEKTPGGATMLIDEGALENPAPEMVFGQHVNPDATTGTVSFVSGPMLASADEISIVITGKGAHAAQPHKGNNPILAASSVINHTQTFLSQERNPLQPGLIAITSIHGGTATNIIPESVELKGTLRSFDQEWREQAWYFIEQTIPQLCSLHGCRCSVTLGKGYPPLINSPEAVSFARGIAERLARTVDSFEPKMWAEDFAYYAQLVPSCFWMLGVRPEGIETMPGLHNVHFTPDEDAMTLGAELLATTAMHYFTTPARQE
ncbi:MAG: M20 family metallopeptidase [Candidatus Kapabacteria bacterium]|jgi:amidohydrolase|nr:M20 family metallopeptidase [Candidatus Kapabacteria bacterium]